MPDEHLPEDPLDVWQSQPVETTYMSIEEIRNKAERFERGIHARNLRETIAAGAVTIVFALYFKWFPMPLARVGCCLTIAGVLYVAARINRQAAAARVPSDCAFDNCMAFHRRELERQRDLLRSVWRWYVGPLVPGVVLFTVGLFGAKVRQGHPGDWWRAAPFLLFLALVCWGIVEINRRGAMHLQRKIDELERVAEE